MLAGCALTRKRPGTVEVNCDRCTTRAYGGCSFNRAPLRRDSSSRLSAIHSHSMGSGFSADTRRAALSSSAVWIMRSPVLELKIIATSAAE